MNRRGQTLVLAYVVVVVLSVLGGSLLTHSLNASHVSQIQQFQAGAFYLAEGGVEDAMAQFAQGIANFAIDPIIPQYPAVGTLGTTFDPSPEFPNGAIVSSVLTEVQPGQQTATDPDGTTVFVKTYEVTTTAANPLNPSTTVTVHQMIVRRLIYTFQHAVFYDGDLEWLPGPNMTLSGKVHSNSDIYLGTGSATSTLTADTTYLHAAGSIYNARKDGGPIPAGSTVQIKDTASGAFVPMNGFDSTDPTWTAGALAKWGGTVQTDVHGVTELAVPVVGSTQPGGFYDSNADVKVVDNTVLDGGTALVPGVDIPLGTVTTSTSFYNNREGKWVQMVNIDLKKLAGYANTSDTVPTFPNHLPDNGLLYATATSVPAANQPGVRLLNGQEIQQSAGLTVVTNDPLYIQGNFNTVAKKPTAVIADAVNLLSTNWSDANSAASLNSRVASSTTVNAAFIAGINTTTPGQYNGGLENYPRLHEKWTGKTLSITGSFVSLWNSQIATGNWVYGAPQYTAPLRNWAYDTSFSSGTVPPFTPWAVQIQRGAWWKE